MDDVLLDKGNAVSKGSPFIKKCPCSLLHEAGHTGPDPCPYRCFMKKKLESFHFPLMKIGAQQKDPVTFAFLEM